LHPRRIRSGVVAGVADYGNKIGLPTVAGAVLYDPGFTANPLVFCGCLGLARRDTPAALGPQPGDRVVVIGGRTGRDGLRGATFSSMTMDATTGEVAGASVQIGDPITEKLLIDVLDEAGGLYRAITDCGAGGLSSAIGEMAEVVGAEVDLALVPLKYPSSCATPSGSCSTSTPRSSTTAARGAHSSLTGGHPSARPISPSLSPTRRPRFSGCSATPTSRPSKT
jgi:phosphoribosylformylglycinamidine (FGAM) synthase-like enzyme